MLFQKRSIFPNVIGWWAWDFICFTRSFPNSRSKRVVPLQFVYCRPRSVSTSFGTPYSPTARRYTSITWSAIWLRYNSNPTMYRE